LELFHDVTYQTSCGQLIDLITAPIGKVDLSKYTIETYMRIVTYKTAFYTFYLPAASAMHLCGVTDATAFATAREICIRLGQFFQIQDDYLDCYGAPEVIGKVGTDIEDNKCSWLVVQAMTRCNDEQRKIVELNYGQNDPAKVAAIKALYKELDLESVFKTYEEKSYQELSALIAGQQVLPQALFMEMLAKIYKRSK
jgi:farnesyl diphosphate synthase